MDKLKRLEDASMYTKLGGLVLTVLGGIIEKYSRKSNVKKAGNMTKRIGFGVTLGGILVDVYKEYKKHKIEEKVEMLKYQYY